jgi:hypothetical protein
VTISRLFGEARVGLFHVNERDDPSQDIALKVGTPGDPDGIGRIQSIQLRLVVALPPRGIIAFRVQGRKEIQGIVDVAPRGSMGALHQAIIPVSRTEEGMSYVHYPQNHLRLLAVNPLNGEFAIQELAVVSQDGNFYFLREVTKTGRFYRNDAGKAVCPSLANWEQFQEFIGDRYAVASRCFEPVAAAPTSFEEELAAPRLANFGRVLFWHAAEGIGCLLTKQGRAKVHWSQLISDKQGKRLGLQRGQVVRFCGIGSPIRNDRTAHRLEVTGVYVDEAHG